MLMTSDAAAIEEALDAGNYDDVIRDRVVSPCGRFESFDLNGYHCVVDWDEIHPPGTDINAPGIPHEQVMEEMDRLFEEVERGQ